MVFKTKQFTLFIVIPECQWEEFEAFRDKCDSPPIQIVSQSTSQPTSVSSSLLQNQIKPLPVHTQGTQRDSAILPPPNTVVQQHSDSPTPLFLPDKTQMGPIPSSIFEQPISCDVERPQVNHTVSCKYFVSHQLSICCRTPVLHPSNIITITLAVHQVDLLHCHH